MAPTRPASVWLFSRQVSGDAGERYSQNVSVYAASEVEAKALVAAEFARLRRLSGNGAAPYQDKPDWAVERVKLDGAKLITLGITQ